MSVVDLKILQPQALGWRRDNTSPLLASFVADVRRLPEVRALQEGFPRRRAESVSPGGLL
jgi:hypothetical protein